MILLLLTLFGQVEHPPTTVGPAQATLRVNVAERVDRHSPPRVRLEMRVSGPATWQIEAVRLSDEVRGWKVRTWSSCRLEGDRQEVCQTLELEQARPGLQAVPVVSVRYRQDDGTFGEFKWPTPLGSLHADLEPDLPRPTPSASVGPWFLTGLVGVMLIAGLVWWHWPRARPVTVATPLEVARRELARLRDPALWRDSAANTATRLNAILRAYLETIFGADLSTRTVSECLALLGQRGQASADLEAVLTWCDATRFAGPLAEGAAGPERVAQAARVVEAIQAAAEFAPAEFNADGSGSSKENRRNGSIPV